MLFNAGCEQLDAVELGLCGNGVLDTGEDCEPAFPDNVHTCNPIGQTNECRISCAPDPNDADNRRYPCPPGWGCGADDVCREPSGTFAAPVKVNVQSLQWLEVGDFNGDDTDDVVTSRDGFTQVYFFDDGQPSDAFDITRQSLTRPVIEDLNDDGRSDLLLPTVEGLAVYRGQTEETLLPTPFLSYEVEVPGVGSVIGFQTMSVLSANLIPEAVFYTPPGMTEPEILTSGAGLEQVAFINGFFASFLSDERYIEDPRMGVFANSVLDIIAGDFDTTPNAMFPASAGTPDEMVAVFDSRDTNELDSAKLIRVSLEVDGNGDGEERDIIIDLDTNAPAPTDIFVETTDEAIERILGTLHFNPPSAGDPNVSNLPCPGDTYAPADEHLDVAFLTSDGVKVAFGRGDGTFHSDACALNDVNLTVDHSMGAHPLFANCMFGADVLAVAQLDGDGVPDLVHSEGVVFSRLVAPSQPLCSVVPGHVQSYEQDPWIEALVVDVNKDGIRDVVAVPDGGGLDLITIDEQGEGAYRNYTNIGRPSSLKVHDLDGDGVNDVVFIDNRDSGPDFLYVLYGEAYATLGEPILIADFEDVLGFGGGRIDDFDGVDDLTITALQQDPDNMDDALLRTGFMLGRPDRQLQAAFQLNFLNSDPDTPVDFDTSIPLFVVAGNFTGGDGNALAMVGVEPDELDDPSRLSFGVASTDGDLTMRMVTKEKAVPPLDVDQSRLTAGAILKITDDDKDRLVAIGSFGKSNDMFAPVDFETTVFTGELGAGDNGDFSVQFDEVGGISFLDVRVLGFVPYEPPDDVEDSGILDEDFVALWAPHVSPASILCNIGDSEGDLDGDGKPDTRDSLIMVVQNMQVHQGNCDGSPTQLLRLERTGTNFDFEDTGSPVLYDPGPGVIITGYACIDNDLDVNKEIAVLTLDYGATDCNFFDRTAVARVHLLSTQDGVVGTPKLIAEFHPNDDALEGLPDGVLGFVVERLGEPPGEDRPPMSGVGAGDFNGDGIDDLIIGEQNNSLLLLGKAMNP